MLDRPLSASLAQVPLHRLASLSQACVNLAYMFDFCRAWRVTGVTLVALFVSFSHCAIYSAALLYCICQKPFWQMKPTFSPAENLNKTLLTRNHWYFSV